MNAFRIILINIAVFIVSLLVTVIFGEAAVRLFDRQDLMTRNDIYVPREEIGYDRRSGMDTTVNVGAGPVRLLTDESGHRIGAQTPSKAAFRIVALGDSFVEALGVRHADTMTGRLERILAQSLGDAVFVANTGVGGYEPNHYFIKARQELSHTPTDLLLVFVYVGNDIVPERIASFPKRPKWDEWPITMPKSLAFDDVLYSLIYPVYRRLIYHSHLAVWMKKRMAPVLLRLGIQKNAWWDVFDTRHAESPSWQVTASILSDIQKFAGNRGVPVLFVLLPSDVQVNPEYRRAFLASMGKDAQYFDIMLPNQILGRKMAERGLDLVDTTAVLLHANEQGRSTHDPFDRHFNATGHELVAELLAPHIISRITQLGANRR